MGTETNTSHNNNCSREEKSCSDLSLLDLGKHIVKDTPQNVKDSWQSLTQDLSDAGKWLKGASSGKISAGEVLQVVAGGSFLVGAAVLSGKGVSNPTTESIRGTEEGILCLKKVAENFRALYRIADISPNHNIDRLIETLEEGVGSRRLDSIIKTIASAASFVSKSAESVGFKRIRVGEYEKFREEFELQRETLHKSIEALVKHVEKKP